MYDARTVVSAKLSNALRASAHALCMLIGVRPPVDSSGENCVNDVRDC